MVVNEQHAHGHPVEVCFFKRRSAHSIRHDPSWQNWPLVGENPTKVQMATMLTRNLRFVSSDHETLPDAPQAPGTA